VTAATYPPSPVTQQPLLMTSQSADLTTTRLGSTCFHYCHEKLVDCHDLLVDSVSMQAVNNVHETSAHGSRSPIERRRAVEIQVKCVRNGWGCAWVGGWGEGWVEVAHLKHDGGRRVIASLMQ